MTVPLGRSAVVAAYAVVAAADTSDEHLKAVSVQAIRMERAVAHIVAQPAVVEEEHVGLPAVAVEPAAAAFVAA